MKIEAEDKLSKIVDELVEVLNKHVGRGMNNLETMGVVNSFRLLCENSISKEIVK